MKKSILKNKTVITMGMVGLLVCAAVSAQATGFSAAQGSESSFALVPLMASIAFSFARKR